MMALKSIHRQRLLNQTCALFLGLLLMGCNVARFVYDRADWFAMVELDSQIDLTDEQEDQVRPKIQQWLAWVKKEEVPKMIRLLKKIELMVQDGLSVEELEDALERMMVLRAEIVEKISVDAAVFSGSYAAT